MIKRRLTALSLLVACSFAGGWLALPAYSQVARPHAPGAADLALQVELDPAARRFSASAQLARAAGLFRFVLHDSLSVRSARLGEQPLSVSSRAAGKAAREWTVLLPHPGTLRVEYEGTLPPLDRGIDHRGVMHGLAPMASPEGSYLGSSTGWYPSPGTLFSYRVALTVHGAQKGLVAGTLRSEQSSPAAYRASFEYAAPADGIDLMAGPYEIRERLLELDGRRLRLRTYFFRDMASLADGYLEDSARYVERFSRQIGAYPFTEFSVVASPLPSGFGMPTLTYVGASVLKLPFIRATSLGHEVLHNWWGNGVLVDYGRGNWAEGLTTFMADYAFKEAESARAARDTRLGWLRDLAAVPQQDQLALVEFRSRSHGAAAVAGYAKAAMLFFMLRDTIGEPAFERGIRQFWAAQRFKAASWEELRAAFEGASARPLGAFFEQWLTRRGAPEVRIVGAHGVGRVLTLAIEQAAPAYALRIPVELVFASHTETRWLETDRRQQKIDIPVEAMPQAVRLDPELRVWRLLERDELPPILRQWIIARTPRVAIASAAPEVRAAALALAARLFEAPHEEVGLESQWPEASSVLLVGLHGEVDAALGRLSLPARPAVLDGKGSAQVWTVPGSGRALAVISAKDAASLEGLLRPLPHYGSQSYLAFEGARVIERGAWPPAARQVPVAR